MPHSYWGHPLTEAEPFTPVYTASGFKRNQRNSYLWNHSIFYEKIISMKNCGKIYEQKIW